ncbi:DoxX family protein [Flavihumibacter solisilvae]|uniref:DoxX family protein n=1 Tax=Flavihumibacter solisilvae TaxID=1349421 RepID=A0A0C1L4I9_9BACT|nr:DoxX family protein [Flavihumibacter solisilvae]KIC95022.1 DoxX family protein [Flavihumibacter solisilvae]
MKKFIQKVTTVSLEGNAIHYGLLVFRILLSLELIVVHGLKKVGLCGCEKEQIPNPLHFPEAFNNLFAIAANLVFPLFVIAGLFTRLTILPVLAVTLTGYFVLHWSDPLIIRDMPYMYSLSFLLLLVSGPGKYSIDNLINKKLLQ